MSKWIFTIIFIAGIGGYIILTVIISGAGSREIDDLRATIIELSTERDNAEKRVVAAEKRLADFQTEFTGQVDEFISRLDGCIALSGETENDLRKALDAIRELRKICAQTGN